MSKKVLSLVLVLAMILGSFSFVAAETLTDIDGHFAEERIQYLFDEGVVSGHGGSGEGTFAPYDKVTRAEFASMVNRALGFTAEGDVEFTDVDEDDWYYEAVSIAVEAGYIVGHGGSGEGTFGPEDPITRQEAAIMISEAYDLDKVEDPTEEFKDADKILDWAVGFVNAVKEIGFIVGDPDGSYRPLDHILRGEAASILHAVYTHVSEEELTIEEDTVLYKNYDKIVVSGDGITVDLNGKTVESLVISGNGVTLKNGTVVNLTIESEVTDLTLEDVKDDKGNEHTFEPETPDPDPDPGPGPGPSPDPTVVDVSDDVQLLAALEDDGVKTINITKTIEEIDNPVIVDREVTINGKGNTLSFTELENIEETEDDGLIIYEKATINNLVVDVGLSNMEDWVGTYAIHVYKTKATLNNVTAKGGNGGILVNGSDVTLTGEINVSGNGHGGIEVSKDTVEEVPSLVVTDANFTNTTESYGKPTIWEDKVENTLTTNDNQFTINCKVKGNQIQYYLKADNAINPEISESEGVIEKTTFIYNGEELKDQWVSAWINIPGELEVKDLTSLKISLYNEENLLVTNTLNETGFEEHGTETRISTSFIRGTEGNTEYAWDRGQYQGAQPNKVLVELVYGCVTYTYEAQVNIENWPDN